MTLLEYMIFETERSAKALMDRARKVPEEKLDWKPLDEGRTVLDLCQECAHCVLWPIELIKAGKFEMNEEVMQEYETTRKQWTSLDLVQAAFDDRLKVFREFVQTLSDADLERKVTFPWGEWSIPEALELPSWNMHYHTGQINYIQTLYGDKEM